MNTISTWPILGFLALGLSLSSMAQATDATPIFDGQTLRGWEGNTNNWRVEDGAIVAGWLDRRQPHNEFLATTREYGNFELRLQYKVEGTNGFVNGGVQFRSQRVLDNFEVSGYQADLGADTDGNLYDESRRNRNLVEAKSDLRMQALKPGDWNDYRIRAAGAHLELWLNGVKTADFVESDTNLPQRGIIALQIHGGAFTKVQYRNLMIDELPSAGLAPASEEVHFELEAGHESLFNGRDLTGWGYITNSFDGQTEASDGRYSAKDGLIIVHPHDPARGPRLRQMWTQRQFPKNFHLLLEFRAAVNADSGLFLREPQLQVRDYLVAGPYKDLKKYRPQDWNVIEVTVKDNVAYCTCNGEVLEEALQLPPTGPIGLEADRDQVEYRRIRLMELP